MKTKRFVLSSAVVVGIGVAISVIVSGYMSMDDPGHPRPNGATRVVLVAAKGMPSVSEPGGELNAVAVAGVLPQTSSYATVLSDENCAPDAAGVSHCLNRMRFDDGAELTVMHPHRMSQVPCLSPGERVMMRPV